MCWSLCSTSCIPHTGPDLVAFLKKSGQKLTTAKQGGGSSCPVLITAAGQGLSTDKEGSGSLSHDLTAKDGGSLCPDLVTAAGQRPTTAGEGRGSSCPDLVTKEAAAPSSQVAQVAPPGGWLHMDVLEKEKLEWTTDIAPIASNPVLNKVENRFSLDGIVISRSKDIPFHLGLHHHGDEPEVRRIGHLQLSIDHVCIVHFPGSWVYLGRALAAW